MTSSKKGFTLVEVLVVMAIISLMIGVLAPKGQKFLDSMHNILAKHDKANSIKKKKLDAFFQDNQDGNLLIFKQVVSSG